MPSGIQAQIESIDIQKNTSHALVNKCAIILPLQDILHFTEWFELENIQCKIVDEIHLLFYHNM